ncbi:hypothetical protein CRENBAI_005958 [Crenichthys baileyi]|uniref:Uncharacterized protein n=1 Tax=Crenichthys baileyi TaxID=28760 RepID=A0AAV9S8B3_9TELE
MIPIVSFPPQRANWHGPYGPPLVSLLQLSDRIWSQRCRSGTRHFKGHTSVSLGPFYWVQMATHGTLCSPCRLLGEHLLSGRRVPLVSEVFHWEPERKLFTRPKNPELRFFHSASRFNQIPRNKVTGIF